MCKVSLVLGSTRLLANLTVQKAITHRYHSTTRPSAAPFMSLTYSQFLIQPQPPNKHAKDEDYKGSTHSALPRHAYDFVMSRSFV